jgi:tetratricopeptide (TPR) repeat protein
MVKNLGFCLLFLTGCIADQKKDEKLSKAKLDSIKVAATVALESTLDYNKTDSLSDILLKNDSNDYDAWKNKAVIYNYNKKFSDALSCINRAIQLKGDAYTYHIKGIIYEQMESTDSAIYYFKKAFSLDSLPIYVTLATEILNKNGRYEEALNLIQTGINKNPTILKMYMYKGIYLSSLGRFEEALENFNIAEEEYKSDELYAGRAIVYSNLDKTEKALQDLNTAIRINPNDARYFDWRGLSKNDLKDMEGALEDFKRSAEMGNEEGKEHYEKLRKKLSKLKSA